MVGDLRPIALCNVLMKIITKVMANRMKDLLDKVVSDSQSAFIPDRLISDNIMISYEVMHYLKRKKVGKDGYMALKLDMSKAYDRIEWEFLKAILLKMGFSQWWVYLVLQCVTTVGYVISHGTYEMGPIVPTRGIRQGIRCPHIYLSSMLKGCPLLFESTSIKSGSMELKYAGRRLLSPTCFSRMIPICFAKLILLKL